MKKRVAIMTMSALVSLVSMPVVFAADKTVAPQEQKSYTLEFDVGQFEQKEIQAGEQNIKYRAYENRVYVSKPVDIQYESMNIYVPEAYYEGKAIGSYTKDTAPIFMPNTVGGYMPGPPGTPGMGRDGKPNAITEALARGYIVAAPGVRGRTLQNEAGTYTGKAPACIVDLKAAVRYLHYNDKVMPGDANKIISNGTSAGGALSALLGATGNNKDFEPYLQEVGAAHGRDDIFAASCYCPITNLDHADMAYEWLFHGVNEYKKMVFPEGFMPSPGQTGERKEPMRMLSKPTEVKGILTEEQAALSDELSALFPAYVNQLGLKKADGSVLTLDADGEGSFKNYIKAYVMASAQKALDAGVDLRGLEWLSVQDGKVQNLNMDEYVRYITRMKSAPAFDAVDLSSGENSLFGTASVNAQHFTDFSVKHSVAGNSTADAKLVHMMNPMHYIGVNGSNVAPYWRIRHGAADRDTSLAIPVILATKLANNGKQVDFSMPWGQGHGGDYDLAELFSWVDGICKTK